MSLCCTAESFLFIKDVLQKIFVVHQFDFYSTVASCQIKAVNYATVHVVRLSVSLLLVVSHVEFRAIQSFACMTGLFLNFPLFRRKFIALFYREGEITTILKKSQ